MPKAASFGTSSSADQAVASVGSAPAPQIVQPVDTLSPDDVAFVLSYAQDVRPDDALIQVRLGVFAKRSNVQGLPLHGRTVYYDVLPHQSYGPLRAGTLAVSDALILARHTTGNSTVLIYTRK